MSVTLLFGKFLQLEITIKLENIRNTNTRRVSRFRTFPFKAFNRAGSKTLTLIVYVDPETIIIDCHSKQ